MAAYFLTTARLGFRTWRPEDVDLALSLWGSPTVARFIYAEPPGRAALEARLTREIAMQTEHGFQYWPIFLLELYPPTGLQHPSYLLMRDERA